MEILDQNLKVIKDDSKFKMSHSLLDFSPTFTRFKDKLFSSYL
nr:hypothetical protein pmam_37 [Pithovirus mammoth]